MLCFFLIIQSYTQQESRRKKILDFGLSVLPHLPYWADFAPSDFYLFSFLQNALNGKKFSLEDQVKMFAENFLSSKPAEFYLRGINKLPDKRQELIKKIMANILLVEINSLLNYSWISYLSASSCVMVKKQEEQTYTSEFESHWVPNSYGLVLCLRKRKSLVNYHKLYFTKTKVINNSTQCMYTYI